MFIACVLAPAGALVSKGETEAMLHQRVVSLIYTWRIRDSV